MFDVNDAAEPGRAATGDDDREVIVGKRLGGVDIFGIAKKDQTPFATAIPDFDVLRLEPYFQLSRPEGAPATVLFINYNFGQTIFYGSVVHHRHLAQLQYRTL
jgi:hypothetical protein